MSQKNNPLELYILGLIKKLDKYARLSRASGASYDIADINNEYLYIEAKQQLTKKNVTIDKDTWDKLLGEVPLHKAHQKPPVLVIENKFNDRFAVMDLEDFFRLLTKALK